MNTLKLVARGIFKFYGGSHSVRSLSKTSSLLVDNNKIIDPPDSIQFDIPKPKRNPNETLEQRKARLTYQSRKRGMLENDLLLSTFAAKHLKSFTEKQIDEYDNLINGPTNDWDIYYMATEMKETPQEYETSVMKMLKDHCKNLKREQRLRQPDL